MNPSGQPFPNQFGGAPPPPGSGGAAAEALNVPGILFIVFGAIGILSALFNMVRPTDMDAFNKALSDPNLPEQTRELLRQIAGYAMGPGAKVMNLISAALSGVMVFGGVQMRQLKNYGLAIATCIIGILPMCGGCCCCLTMPLGIWALTILMRPEIKSAFT